MAKPIGPLLSLSASGSIANTLTFSKWRGIPYIRQRVIPSNPQSSAQTLTRNAFKWTSDVWRSAPTLVRAPWSSQAAGQPFTDRNAFMGANTEVLRPEVDIQNLIFSNGSLGGLAPSSIATVAGSTQIQVDFTNPAAPTGWTLVSAVAAAILDQDPQTELNDTWTAGEDSATQAQVILTGLTASVLYVVGGWLEWLKPDGTTAYGASLVTTETPTV